jgi:AcrR family transcriptional regulator
MTATGIRMSSDQRREEVLRAAVAEFAERGFAGTSTDAIARRAGISQPYLFRLFATKKDLFISATTRCVARIKAEFEKSADGLVGQEALTAMGHAYRDLLADRQWLLLQMQMYVESHDPEIRDAARAGFADLWATVERVSGASEEDVVQFFAIGMLLNTAAAMELDELDDRWARLATLRQLE